MLNLYQRIKAVRQQLNSVSEQIENASPEQVQSIAKPIIVAALEILKEFTNDKWDRIIDKVIVAIKAA